MPRNTPGKPLAVYVHWPWCKAKCPYCDFNSHGLDATPLREDDYVAALCQELFNWGQRLTTETSQKRPLASVFFGGGTPSLMRPASIRRVLEACSHVAEIGDFTEITVECNPTSSSATLFESLAAVGVNRISVGIQGLQADWLAFLGRAHSAGEALATLEAAQRAINNVNADVIYGLPDQNLQDWEKQLERLTQLGLQHISAYQLTIEPNTRFYGDVRRGLWTPIDSDLEADFFDATRNLLTLAGYQNYEISNFARPDRACAHNVHVWRYRDYLGIGAGAHGRITLPDGTRLATSVMRHPEGYLRAMKDRGEAFAAQETIDAFRGLQEAVFSGLRLAEGIDPEALQKTFGNTTYTHAVETMELVKLTETGFLKSHTGRIQLSDTGWPRLNSLLRRLLRRPEEFDRIAYNNNPSVIIEQHPEGQE